MPPPDSDETDTSSDSSSTDSDSSSTDSDSLYAALSDFQENDSVWNRRQPSVSHWQLRPGYMFRNDVDLNSVTVGKRSVMSRQYNRQLPAISARPLHRSPYRPHHYQGFATLLPNGTQLRIYTADITRIPVDAIVVPTNENLSHNGGVAKAVLAASRSPLQKYCDEYLRKHGSGKVSDVVFSGGHRDPYNNIIYVISPNWRGWNKKEKTKELLVKSLDNAFRLANESKRVAVLAVPPIGAGKEK